ncbi:hypothetical protein [Streptomyces katrae]|uniref:hypothetical protein n=1 Tax=Streptomyces katrae TaxID=68223 RepID=UPI001F20D411|nr:hypothetical protein [Streptomyces katrae]
MRGANQPPPDGASAGACGAGAGACGAAADAGVWPVGRSGRAARTGGWAWPRGAGAGTDSAEPGAGSAEPSFTGLRTTTGGIGREPGMLIRIRVVRVVSVFGPSVSGVDGFELTGFSSGAVAPGRGGRDVGADWPVPYGGVPEG